jgi:mxaJ protein
MAALIASACSRPSAQVQPHQPSRVLRVCADPNNLPFSNARGEGFENRVAELIAAELGTRVEYTWWAQRRGFVRNTLDAGKCDVVIGVPHSYDLVLTTQPYYRSTYVFVAPRATQPPLRSLDDPRLERMKVGVQMIGDDFNNTPPAHALARRGLTRNVIGYSVYGDYSQPNPLASIVRAVSARDVDAALVWGPAGGYFARDAGLEVTPIDVPDDGPARPFVFDIAMGVRHKDVQLRNQLNAFIDRRRADIDAILADFGVPRVPGRVEAH